MQRRQTSGGLAGTSAVATVAAVITHSIGNVGEMLFITIIIGSRPPVAQCSRASFQIGAAEAATMIRLMAKPQ